MKLILPKYYKSFHCIANKCKNNCCSAGWEIDIDEKTLEFYKSIKGEFGEKLKQNIKFSKTSNFILDKNNNCPFLNKEKLCEIYLKLGPNSLCTICMEHPRFYEYFKNKIEGGIGLCCEESARIILSQTEKFSTYEIETKYEKADYYDEKIYTYLFKCRKKIILYLENASIPLNNRIKDILWFSYTIQQNINSNLLDDENIFSVKSYSNSNIEPIINFLQTLEINNPCWPEYLKKSIIIYNSSSQTITNFEKSNPQISNYLKNISIYFIWRYFLKGVFDEDIISKVKLMVLSVATIKFLFFCKWIENKEITLNDCIEIVRNYSEEIEYSENNIYSIEEASYNLEIFDTENLLGLFEE